MSDDGDDPKQHNNPLCFVAIDDGIEAIEVEPHSENDCEEACERAIEKYLGHETIYEDRAARPSVGYSRAYAANFDKAFGKN